MIEWISANSLPVWLPEADMENSVDLQNIGMPRYVKASDMLDLRHCFTEIVPVLVNDFVSTGLLLGLKELEIVYCADEPLVEFMIYKTLATSSYIKHYYEFTDPVIGSSVVVLSL